MVISKKQLQQLVNEELTRLRTKRSLNEGSGAVSADVAEFMVPKLVGALEMLMDDISNDVIEAMRMSYSDNDIPLPARYEDVDGFSEKIAFLACRSPEVMSIVGSIAIRVLEGLMESDDPDVDNDDDLDRS